MKLTSIRWFSAIAVAAAIMVVGQPDATAETVDFEDVGATLAGPPNDYWNGSDMSGTPAGQDSWGGDIYEGGFDSGLLHFSNTYTYYDYGPDSFGAWEKWAYSKATDTTTPGYTNQFSATTGSGAGGSATYGVAFQSGPDPVSLAIPLGWNVTSAQFVNTTYAYLAIRDGDTGPPPPTGPDPFTTGDFFRLDILGFQGGNPLGSVPFSLADYGGYSAGANKDDFIVTDWTEVDLSPLAGATELRFQLTTSDVDPLWGPNTPMYFAMDNLVLTAAPEPSTWVLLLGGVSALLVGRWRRRMKRAG
jgi:hypothetical protein